MKFKFIHKISVIRGKSLVLFNLLRGLDVRGSGPDPARGLCIPGISHPEAATNVVDILRYKGILP